MSDHITHTLLYLYIYIYMYCVCVWCPLVFCICQWPNIIAVIDWSLDLLHSCRTNGDMWLCPLPFGEALSVVIQLNLLISNLIETQLAFGRSVGHLTNVGNLKVARKNVRFWMKGFFLKTLRDMYIIQGLINTC